MSEHTFDNLAQGTLGTEMTLKTPRLEMGTLRPVCVVGEHRVLMQLYDPMRQILKEKPFCKPSNPVFRMAIDWTLVAIE